MADDGSDAIALTQAPGSHTLPKWSPDGSRIVFTSSRNGQTEIYTMKVDGTNPTRLTDDPRSDTMPAWSPDGERIVWAAERAGGGTPNFEIFTMKVDGTDIQQLTTNDALDFSADRSPGGGSIVFSSDRDGAQEMTIYKMRADGSRKQLLADRPGVGITGDDTAG